MKSAWSSRRLRVFLEAALVVILAAAVSGPYFGYTTLLYLNTRKKPFDDKNVRKAISMAIDRERITTEALSCYAPPADAAGLARGADGIRTVPGGGRMRYDIHAVAGWSNSEAAASIIQQSLADVGIAAAAVPLPYQAWSDALQTGRFDMGIWGSTRGPTPYQFYRGQMDPDLVRRIGEKAVENFQRFASAEAAPILRRFEASSEPPSA